MGKFLPELLHGHRQAPDESGEEARGVEEYLDGGRTLHEQRPSDLSVVQVNQMVELGSLDPEAVVTPSIFIDRVVVVGANA